MNTAPPLQPADLQLLSRRFGLDGTPGMTLEALALEMGISREQVRWRETRALRAARAIPAFARRIHGDESDDAVTSRPASNVPRLVF